MSVNVSYKGTVHSYGVSRGMLVQNLKEEISRKQNLHQFKLMLGNVELLDRSPVIKYLFTTFALCYDNKEAAVEINDLNFGVAILDQKVQKVFTEIVTPEMTIRELKERISRKLSSTQGKWTLKKDGKEIPDGDLLKTHIERKTFTVNTQYMQVTIRYHRSNYCITTRSDITVFEFKSLCCEKIGIPVDTNIFMKFNGRFLTYLDYVEDHRIWKDLWESFHDDTEFVIEDMVEEKNVANETLTSLGITHDSIIEIIHGWPISSDSDSSSTE